MQPAPVPAGPATFVEVLSPFGTWRPQVHYRPVLTTKGRILRPGGGHGSRVRNIAPVPDKYAGLSLDELQRLLGSPRA